MGPLTDGVRSLAELLQRQCQARPRSVVAALAEDGQHVDASLTFAQLDVRAAAIAAALRERIQPGDRVVLLHPPGLDYLAALFGCLYARAIAVPAYPPLSRQALRRILAVVEDAEPALALSTAAVQASARRLWHEQPRLAALPWLATDELPDGASWRDLDAAPADLAILQYTSGSTGSPRGAMISHANLLHNMGCIHRCMRIAEGDVGVTWLPPYHDMGLIGGLLQAVYDSGPVYILPTAAFVQEPRRWLAAISHFGATHSGAPNFALELCVRRIPPEQRQGLDLSSWRVAYCGAEPIRAGTLAAFVEAFEPFGFRADALYPCYGMAEATLLVSGSELARPPRASGFEVEALEHGRAAPSEDGRELVSCGPPCREHQLRIVDPRTHQALSEGRIGEVWLASDSVAQGYWGRADESAETFGATLAGDSEPFLRTGDLGFLHAGELFITGRLKDVIIIHGRNHYPQDLELSVAHSCAELEDAQAAAFAVETDQGERLMIAAEVRREALRRLNPDAVERAVRQRLWADHEVEPLGVALVRPGGLPVTTSGKIQRSECRDRLLAGDLALVERATPPVLSTALAPSPLAARLRSEAARLLGVPPDEVRHDVPVSALGIDSLKAVELQLFAFKELGAAIDLADLAAGLSLADIAARIEHGTPAKVEAANFAADAVLDLPPSGGAPRPASPGLPLASASRPTAGAELALPPAGSSPRPAEVGPELPPVGSAARPSTGRALLTGATGFLGGYLLRELLDRTDWRVLCLARGSARESGLERVEGNLRRYGLWGDGDRARLALVEGDLAQPRLGLTPAGWDELAAGVDAIWHCGAWLNFVYPYAALKAANVDGTRELLRLAAQASPIPVHYVSTTAIFDVPAYNGRTVFEDDEAASPDGLLLGYAQSKWVAERLATLARQQGLPVSTYRVPWLVADSVSGASNVDDFLTRSLRGCIGLQAAPALDYWWHAAPVDFTAKALVHLSLQDRPPQTYHVLGTSAVPWRDMLAGVRHLGYPIEELSYDDWLARLLAAGAEGEPLRPLLPFFLERRGEAGALPQLYERFQLRFDQANAAAGLAGSNIACPPFDDRLLARLLEQLAAGGLLPQPRAAYA